ncbi:unnamed protein product [Gadus morhua 'NCC']
MSLAPRSCRSEEERAVGYWLIDVEGGDAVLVVEDTENRTHDNHFTGEKSVPTPLSCTSVLQTWTKDTGDSLQGIRPEPIDQLVVRKPKVANTGKGYGVFH